MNQIEEAFKSFSEWESWLSTRFDGLLDDLDTEQKANLYVEMVGQPAEIQRLRKLLRRAMLIISDAIMHGMPITEEVAAVRNAIVCEEKITGDDS